jgi:hypothetical protein
MQWDRKAKQPTKTMSDTPETDSLLEGEGTQRSVDIVELLDLCRKMERERDEARDTKWAREIHSCHNACARPICVLRRERDEATERVAEAETLLADLAESYWRTILNDQDPSGEGLMGERVAQYWARYSHVMFKWVKYCEDTDQPKP